MKRDLLSIAKQWPDSGLTQKEFCKQHKLTFNTLQYGLRRLRRKGGATKGFVELISKQPESSNTGIMEVHFVNGTRMVFFSNPDPAFIKSLIS